MPDRVPARRAIACARRHDFQPRVGRAAAPACRPFDDGVVDACRRLASLACWRPPRLRRRSPRLAPVARSARAPPPRPRLRCSATVRRPCGTRKHRALLQAVDVVADEGIRIGAQQRQHGLVEAVARRGSSWPAICRQRLSPARTGPYCRGWRDRGCRRRDCHRRGIAGGGWRRIAVTGAAVGVRRAAVRPAPAPVSVAARWRRRRRAGRWCSMGPPPAPAIGGCTAPPRCAARPAMPNTRAPAGPAPSRPPPGRSAAAGSPARRW